MQFIRGLKFFNSEEKGTPDESDRFMMDPVGFATKFAKNWSVPSHIVLFDSEEKLLKDFLVSHSFKEVYAQINYYFEVLHYSKKNGYLYCFAC